MANFGKLFEVGLIFDMVDRVSGPLSKMNAAMMATEHRALRIGESLSRSGQAMTSAGMKMAATGAAMAAAFVLPVKSAIEFESKMYDIKKVVDFPTPESFRKMSDEIERMTYGANGIAMSVGEVQDIMREAGESDIAKTHEELLAFTRDAAKMGVAFNVSGGEAGKIMTSWRMSMNLTQDQAIQLADAVNYLSNNMASNAADLSEILKRQGSVGVKSGLNPVQVAALASAMKSTGIETEIAATGMKNFLNALTQGEKATDKDVIAFQKLGLDAVKVAKMMQKDALPTIMDVLQRIQKIPEWQQPAIISQIFGEESKGAIMPLLTNLDLLRKGFGLVGDSSKYAGSMQNEFNVQNAKTENAVELAWNAIKALGRNLGDLFLPSVTKAANAINLFVERLINWGKEHQTLTKILTLGTAGLSAFLVVVGGGLALLGLFVSGVGSAITGFIKLRAAMMLLTGTSSLTAAVLFNPITMGALGLAAAAVLVYDNWDKVGVWFKAAGAWIDGFYRKIKPVLQTLGMVKTDTEILFEEVARKWSGKTIEVSVVASSVPAALTQPGAVGPIATPQLNANQTIMDAQNAGERAGSAFAGHLQHTITQTREQWEWLKGKFNEVGSVWGQMSTAMSRDWDLFCSQLSTAANSGWGNVKSIASSTTTWIDEKFRTTAQLIITSFDWIGQKWDQIVTKIKSLADSIASKFSEVWTSITSFDLFGAGQRMIQRLIDGIMSKISAVTEAVKGVASSISNYLVPHSPIPMGPLSEVHLAGYRLMDMVRQGIEASPITRALNDALAYSVPQMAMAGAQYPFQSIPQVPQQAENQSFPALSRARAGSGGLSASPSVQVSLSYSPTITVQGDGVNQGAMGKMLSDNSRDMEDKVYSAVKRALQRQDRVAFGGEDLRY